MFKVYELGLQSFLNNLDKTNPTYSEVLVLQSRLLENVSNSRLFGDTEALRSERAQILLLLNSIALGSLGISFNDICQNAKRFPPASQPIELGSDNAKEIINMSSFERGYALVVGIADYPQVRKLSNTVVKDAIDVQELLISPAYCGYSKGHVRTLINGQATGLSIREGLDWLAETTSIEDTGIIFFSGHGGRVMNGPEAGNYIIPFDCDPKRLSDTAISGSELTSLFHRIMANRLVVLFDCCYSGGTGDVKELSEDQPEFKDGLDELYYEQLAQGVGRVIMASSRTGEVSLVLPGMENSLFTYYLLDALKGNARTRGDGLIRVFDIFDHVSEEVPSRGNQHPIFKAHDLENNFAIALFLGGKKIEFSVSSVTPRQTAVDKRSLREAILKHFDVDELEIICSDIEQALLEDGIKVIVNLEMVGGNSKSVKVLNLINYLDRRELLAYLVSAVRRERPGII